MANESNPQSSGFFTPMRIVTVCGVAAVGIVIWLSSSKSSEQPNQPPASATPVVQINPPNAVANPAPPVAAVVPLADSIRETKVKTIDGGSLKLADFKNKVVVVNLWATWCGPCHALEPLFAHVAADFHDQAETLFLSANCDEDETLVAPYLQKDKIATEVLFADGLDRLFSVDSFPTVIVLDRQGKIAFRSDGFQPDTFEHDLSSAVHRALEKTGAAP